MNNDSLIGFAEKISSVAFWVMCILAVFVPLTLFRETPLYAFMFALVSMVALFLGYGVLLATFGIYNQLKMLNRHFNPQAFDGFKLLDYTPKDDNAKNTAQSFQMEQTPIEKEKVDTQSAIQKMIQEQKRSRLF